MNPFAKIAVCGVLFVTTLHAASAADFFSIGQIKFLSREPSRGPAVYKEVKNKEGKTENLFLPCLTVKLRTNKDTRADATYARVYFFDGNREKIASSSKPSAVDRGKSKNKYALPALFKARKDEEVYFEVPAKVLAEKRWSAVIVFGDKHAAVAKVHPHGRHYDFDFPERKQVDSPVDVERKEAMDPVVEYVIKTRNPKQPKITLLLRPPIGMTDATEANGVLALCALANSVGDLKRRLQTLKPNDDLSWVLKFAEKHKLVILCWGSTGGVLNRSKSWFELTEAEQDKIDHDFEDISDAWARAVKDLSRKYGFPDDGLLMVGHSAAAQYSIAIALRHPELFQAVYIHIPSTFDKPLPSANRPLWCLTTGELEYGYPSSLRFFRECRELGYPMIYKAIIGLGHQGSPYAERVGEAFLEWAQSQKSVKEAFQAELDDTFSPVRRAWEENPFRPWPPSYQNPPFVGDAVNQEMFPWKDRGMVPSGFQVPLPTEELAKAWNAQKP